MTAKKTVKKITSMTFLSLMAMVANGRQSQAVDVKVGGKIFAYYQMLTSQHLKTGAAPDATWSSFDIGRIYLSAEAKFSDRYSGYINLEDDMTSSGGQNNRVFLKNAELRAKFHPMAHLALGLDGTPWNGYEEGIWLHRFAAKTFADEEGLIPSADRGLKLSGKVPFLAYDLMMANGEGVGADSAASNESTTAGGGGRLKDYIVKGTIVPFEGISDALKGFKVNLYAHKGDATESKLRNRMFGGLSYESDPVNFMFTYYNADNSAPTGPSRGEGFSAHTVVKPWGWFWILARFDRYDPNINVGGDVHNRYIGGIGFQLVKGIRLSIDEQYLQQESRTATRQDESFTYVHSEVSF